MTLQLQSQKIEIFLFLPRDSRLSSTASSMISFNCLESVRANAFSLLRYEDNRILLRVSTSFQAFHSDLLFQRKEILVDSRVLRLSDPFVLFLFYFVCFVCCCLLVSCCFCLFFVLFLFLFCLFFVCFWYVFSCVFVVFLFCFGQFSLVFSIK